MSRPQSQSTLEEENTKLKETVTKLKKENEDLRSLNISLQKGKCIKYCTQNLFLLFLSDILCFICQMKPLYIQPPGLFIPLIHCNWF